MYILQISDLHINNETDESYISKKLILLNEELKKIIKNSDKIVCCILGDIIDKGVNECYKKATGILANFLNDITCIVGDKNFKCYIVPGNHDLCDDLKNEKTLKCFNEFVTGLGIKQSSFDDGNRVQEDVFMGYHFIKVSSVKKNNSEYGEIDISQLYKHIVQPKTILLVHHSLISSSEEDNAVIRNGYAIQKFLEENSIIALLHGHTHGFKRYTVGNDCQVIGVGPMFKQEIDISNQCNLIYVSGNKVNNIKTFIYQEDHDKWFVEETYKRDNSNNYYGSSVNKLYQRILTDVESDCYILNLRFQVKQRFDIFEQEINKYFSMCFESAKEWQSFDSIKTLDYTHAQLMSTKDENWSSFVIRKLKDNPTNKRTIIPLITKEDVYSSTDEKLVSFDLVQFGFQDSSMKDLYLTVYMRALEVRHFLPINICEAYLMIKKIKKDIQMIENITLCIFAFRAEQKLEYGCYRKSKIDLMSESDLCKIINENDYSKMKELLEEKCRMRDTVIDSKWVDNLKSAMRAFYNLENKQEVLSILDKIESKLNAYKKARLRCSDYTKTLKEENEFRVALYELKKNMG